MIMYRTAGCPVFSIVINMEPRLPLALEMIVREKEREREAPRPKSNQPLHCWMVCGGQARPFSRLFLPLEKRGRCSYNLLCACVCNRIRSSLAGSPLHDTTINNNDETKIKTGKCVCVDSVHHDDDVVTLSMADHLTAAQDSNQIRIHSVTSPGDFSLLTKK